MGKKVTITLNTAKETFIKNILGNIYMGKRYVVPMYEGASGIGKSTFVRQAKKELEKITGTEWGFLDIRLPSYEASDLQGIPFPVKTSTGEERLKWLKDSTFPSQYTKLTGGNIVSFQDVLNSTSFDEVYGKTSSQPKETNAIQFGTTQPTVENTVTSNETNALKYYESLELIKNIVSGAVPLTTIEADINHVNEVKGGFRNEFNDFMSSALQVSKGTSKETEIRTIVDTLESSNSPVGLLDNIPTLTDTDKQTMSTNYNYALFLINILKIIEDTNSKLEYISTPDTTVPSESTSTPPINTSEVSSSFDTTGEFSKDYQGQFPKYGIILLDEFNQVENRAVQSLTYQLILDHKINDMIFPDTWYFVCLGNREEDGGVYERIKAPVRNRLKIYDISVSKQETVDYFSSIGVHPAVVSFIENQTMQSALHTYDAEAEEYDEEGENYVFATPRSWEFVSEALYLYEELRDQKDSINNELIQKIASRELLAIDISSLIGSDVGTAFMDYYKNTEAINIKNILTAEWKNGEPVPYPSGKPKVTYKIDSDCVNYLLQLAFKCDSSEKFIKIYIYIAWVASKTTGVVGEYSLQLLSNTCNSKGYTVDFDRFKIESGTARLFN